MKVHSQFTEDRYTDYYSEVCSTNLYVDATKRLCNLFLIQENSEFIILIMFPCFDSSIYDKAGQHKVFF